jgi:Zn-dependent protease with chaperone function
MKIISKKPEKTADISAARGKTGKEFRTLMLLAVFFIVGLYFFTGLIVDLVVPAISFETEAALFKNVLPAGLKKMDAAKKPADLKKAEAILNKLKTGENVPPLPFDLILIENEDPNAFAFPGGRIGLTTGLLKALKDDIEIAFVIGHELGHFYHRDHLRGFGRAAGFGIIMALVFGTSPGAESLSNIMNFVLMRNYSQDRETAADRFALDLVHAVYGQVKGTDRLFKIIRENKNIPDWAYMLSTHPSPSDRINELEKYAKQLKFK